MPIEVLTEEDGLRVKWDPDGHTSVYPLSWIQNHASKSLKPKLQSSLKRTFWGASIHEKPPSIHYDKIMEDDKGVGAWTAIIREYGFCFVDNCPISPEKTQELLERIAFIRVTHYGGFYDFTADLTMKDTAYTNLALPAHTDNTYFSEPSGLQAFHLLSHTSGSGGESLLVDGFHAASILREESPLLYRVLMRTPIPWHASGNEGITITPCKDFPVFEHGNGGVAPLEDWKVDEANEWTEIMRIRWNNDDRGVVGLKSHLGVKALQWYEAARLWNQILKRENIEYWSQLKPGRPLIFDNWRVLHGRAAFTGKRRMCGGYINHDDYISRWRNTNFNRQEVLSQIL